jgi:shikimate kinase
MLPALPVSDRNLILTGTIGPSQPLIGRRIAERLRLPYVNVEMLLAERVGMPVDEIRTYFGETRLKVIEAEIVAETALRRSTVIRVSGRTLAHGENRSRLAETGPIFCPVIALGAMLRKLHIALGARFHDPNERGLALSELRREWVARGLPGVIEIDVTTLDEEAIIALLIDRWQELALVRG